MEIQIKIIGTVLIIVALLHFLFPKYFNWKEELISLSVINRQLMYVHSFFIAFFVFLIGLLSLTSTFELLNTALGKRICLGLGIFWITRLYVQFFVYSPNIWKGKFFETIIHIALVFFWAHTSIVFLLAYFHNY